MTRRAASVIPARRGRGRRRTPNWKSGNGPSARSSSCLRSWACVNAGELAAVGGVRGTRSDGPIRTRVHVVPPEELCAGEAGETAARRFPDFPRRDEAVGLSPEPDLRRSRKYQPLPTMPCWRGRVPVTRGLARAGDRREHAAERHHETRLRQRGEGRSGRRHLGGREPDDVEDDERRQPACPAPRPPRARCRGEAASSVDDPLRGAPYHV